MFNRIINPSPGDYIMLEVDKPFIIRNTADNSFVRGLDTEREANDSCAARNEAAVKLGIKARYVVTTNS